MHLWGLFIAAMLNTNVDLGTAGLRPEEEEEEERSHVFLIFLHGDWPVSIIWYDY